MYCRSTHILDLAYSFPMMLFNPNPFYFLKWELNFEASSGSGLISSEDLSQVVCVLSVAPPPVSLLTMSDMICGVEVLSAGTIH